MFIFVEGSDQVDVAELKLYLHRANLHKTNPALFKRINDYDAKVTSEQQL